MRKGQLNSPPVFWRGGHMVIMLENEQKVQKIPEVSEKEDTD